MAAGGACVNGTGRVVLAGPWGVVGRVTGLPRFASRGRLARPAVAASCAPGPPVRWCPVRPCRRGAGRARRAGRRGDLGGDGDVAGIAVLSDGSEQQQLLRADLRRRPVGRGRGHPLGGEQSVHDHRGLAAGRAVEALADVADVADVLADGDRRQSCLCGDLLGCKAVREVLGDALQGRCQGGDRCAGRHGRGHDVSFSAGMDGHRDGCHRSPRGTGPGGTGPCAAVWIHGVPRTGAHAAVGPGRAQAASAARRSDHWMWSSSKAASARRMRWTSPVPAGG
jgi:hypothetical protein